LLRLYMYIGHKITINFAHSDTFCYLFTDSYQFLMFKGLDFILRTNGTHHRLLAMAESETSELCSPEHLLWNARSEEAPLCSFGLMKTFNIMLFYAYCFVLAIWCHFSHSLNFPKVICVICVICVTWTLALDLGRLHLQELLELLNFLNS